MLSTFDPDSPILTYVPERYRHATLAQLSSGLQAAIADIQGDSRGVWFYGKVGRGKTHAMAAIANVTRQSGDLAAKNWVDWHEFCRDVRAFWNIADGDVTKRRFDPIAWAVRAPMLFIDDLGAERDEKGLDHFDAIVLGRYNARKPLCFTTNLTVKEFEERYGDRVASRIMELAEPIECDGIDRRRARHLTVVS